MTAVGNVLFVIILFSLIVEVHSMDAIKARNRLTSWLRKLGLRGNLNAYFNSSHPIFEIFFKERGVHKLGKRLRPPTSLHMKWLWTDRFADAVRKATLLDIYD